LMKILDKYVEKTNKKVFYEYIMIAWVNDDIKLAHELWRLLEWRLAHVNFIPYNSWEISPNPSLLRRGKDRAFLFSKEENSLFSPTPRPIIEKFQSILQHYWVVSTIRATMWDDIDAACGQLASRSWKLKVKS
jgi:23S rRNA (adenine2503-C2)-methyltransferase